MIGTRDLQTTMLEGYGMAPLNLNMSAINNKSMFGKAPLLGRTMSKKTEFKFFITSQKRVGEGSFHKKRQKTWPWSHIFWCWLCCLWRWKTWGHMPWKKQRQVLRPMMTAVILNAQMEVVGPFQAMVESFKVQHKTMATALNTIWHELLVQSSTFAEIGRNS